MLILRNGGGEMLDQSWSKPSQQLTLWMQGLIHTCPPVTWEMKEYVRRRRRQLFYAVMRTASPESCMWPEFHELLKSLRLERAWQNGIISTEVAAVLIAQHNRSVGTWLNRARRMQRDQKNPLKRRRYRRAARCVYQATMIARKMYEMRRFETTHHRAMEG